MIPKAINYCWFGGEKKPKSVKRCIESWKKICPDYEIVEWNESNFDVNAHPFVKEAYKSKAWAFVSDYARLKIVYDNGGIYLDTDVELIKSLNPLLDDGCFLAVGQEGDMVATGLGFGAEKEHMLIAELMREYDNIVFDQNKINQIACPFVSKKALDRLGFLYDGGISSINGIKCKIYPPEFFDPIAPGNNVDLLSSRSFSIHHYDASWTLSLIHI